VVGYELCDSTQVHEVSTEHKASISSQSSIHGPPFGDHPTLENQYPNLSASQHWILSTSAHLRRAAKTVSGCYDNRSFFEGDVYGATRKRGLRVEPSKAHTCFVTGGFHRRLLPVLLLLLLAAGCWLHMRLGRIADCRFRITDCASPLRSEYDTPNPWNGLGECDRFYGLAGGRA
jgi:hypothetical protein